MQLFTWHKQHILEYRFIVRANLWRHWNKVHKKVHEPHIHQTRQSVMAYLTPHAILNRTTTLSQFNVIIKQYFIINKVVYMETVCGGGRKVAVWPYVVAAVGGRRWGRRCGSSTPPSTPPSMHPCIRSPKTHRNAQRQTIINWLQ